MDETGMPLNNRPSLVIGKKGEATSITSKERGENVTVVAAMSAAGQFIPPFVIFKGKRNHAEWQDNMPPGTKVTMTESGYINEPTFLEWMKHFNQHRPHGRCLLILDGHVTHCKSLNVLDFAEENQITLVSLPPHTTHYLQPLDKTFFKPLKIYYHQECNKFVKASCGESITKYRFGNFLKVSWNKSAIIENATNGFRSTGIYPLNQLIIPNFAYIADAIEREHEPGPMPTTCSNISTEIPSTGIDACLKNKVMPESYNNVIDELKEISPSPKKILKQTNKLSKKTKSRIINII